MTAAMSPVRQDEVWAPEPVHTARPVRASEQAWRVTPRRTAVVITDLLPARSAPQPQAPRSPEPLTRPQPPVRPTRHPAPQLTPRRSAEPRALRVGTVPAPVDADQYRRRRLTAAAGLAVASLAVVGVVAGLGQVLPGAGADPAVPAQDVPTQVSVERVGAGETLWDVAARVAPDSDPAAVVERIRQLNVMGGSAVSAGETLRVPDGR